MVGGGREREKERERSPHTSVKTGGYFCGSHIPQKLLLKFIVHSEVFRKVVA